ncbi:MAG: hypothetical protein HUJ83_11330, partial [Veillonella sp.]|nr:hypothetical protein [Veillonella sp.]
PAMSGLWTNLDSFGVERFEEELARYDVAEVKPMVIESSHDNEDVKDRIIRDYLDRNEYKADMSNESFVVYIALYD